jgi:gamma-glutamyltranspeptidase/glutathione hydrolase
VLQVILNVVDFDMGIMDAVNAPRIHHQWKPDCLLAEKMGFGKDVLENLEERGHLVEESLPWGSVQAILYDEESGLYFGAADKRLEGAAAGY